LDKEMIKMGDRSGQLRDRHVMTENRSRPLISISGAGNSQLGIAVAVDKIPAPQEIFLFKGLQIHNTISLELRGLGLGLLSIWQVERSHEISLKPSLPLHFLVVECHLSRRRLRRTLTLYRS
jgi:hypothetical protein